MLSQKDETKLREWFERQQKNIKEKFGVSISTEFALDMNKSLLDNKNALEEKLKFATLQAQGISIDTSTKKPSIKNPFQKITNAEYRNIMRQLQESNQQDLAFTSNDIGADANETIALEYFKNNYGLSLKSIADTRISPVVEAEAQKQKAEEEYRTLLHKEREEAETRIQEMADKIMANGGCPLLDKAERIYNYFQEQNLGCEHITLLSQFGLFGYGTKFMYEGNPGIGKSKSSVEQIARFASKIDTQRIKILSGHITPLQMYILLYNFKESKDLIICDESFGIVTNKDIQHMLKDALFRGRVYWESTSNKLPDYIPPEFGWGGNIILNTNGFGRDTGLDTTAFLDRIVVIKIVLSNEKIISKMLNSRTSQIDKLLEQEMIDRIIAIRSGKITVDITDVDKDYYYQLIINEVRYLTKDFSNISFRTLQKCELIYKCFKLYFGGFNEFTKNWFSDIATQIIKGNTTENFIVSSLKQARGRMKTSELRELIQDHFQCGRTVAYDRINQLKESGLIEEEGRRTTILKAVVPNV